MPTDGEDRVLNPGWVILCDEGLRRLHYGMRSERSMYSIRPSFLASGFQLSAIGYWLSAIGFRCVVCVLIRVRATESGVGRGASVAKQIRTG